MWTGPNVPDDTTNDLYLQNINRNQIGTFMDWEIFNIEMYYNHMNKLAEDVFRVIMPCILLNIF
jgi:hypothetical protein